MKFAKIIAIALSVLGMIYGAVKSSCELTEYHRRSGMEKGAREWQNHIKKSKEHPSPPTTMERDNTSPLEMRESDSEIKYWQESKRIPLINLAKGIALLCYCTLNYVVLVHRPWPKQFG